MAKNGRYLFAFSSAVPFVSSSLFCAAEDSGVGYSHATRSVCEARSAIWLEPLMARWALIKTRKLEMACDRERIENSESQAIGLVSRMTVSSDAGVPPACCVS
jgi:hypothetical protein